MSPGEASDPKIVLKNSKVSSTNDYLMPKKTEHIKQRPEARADQRHSLNKTVHYVFDRIKKEKMWVFYVA